MRIRDFEGRFGQIRSSVRAHRVRAPRRRGRGVSPRSGSQRRKWIRILCRAAKDCACWARLELVPLPGARARKHACFTSFAGGATDLALCGMSEDEIGKSYAVRSNASSRHRAAMTRLVHRYTAPCLNTTSAIPKRFRHSASGFYCARIIPRWKLSDRTSIGSCVEQANQTPMPSASTSRRLASQA